MKKLKHSAMVAALVLSATGFSTTGLSAAGLGTIRVQTTEAKPNAKPTVETTQEKECKPEKQTWTVEARQENPRGFLEYLKTQISTELKQMQSTQQTLATQIASHADKIREIQGLNNSALQLAQEFRCYHQRGCYPVELHGTMYVDRMAVESQISMLLAEAGGYQGTLNQLVQVKRTAERGAEALTVKINHHEVQLTIIDTRIVMLEANGLSQEAAEQLVYAEDLVPNLPEGLTEHEQRVQQFLGEISETDCRENVEKQNQEQTENKTQKTAQNSPKPKVPMQAQIGIKVPCSEKSKK